MALKPFSKDKLLSSTPLQSPGDSGYFGSGQRRNNAIVLNSCSPIKELTFKDVPENIRFMHDLSPQVKLKKNINFESLARNDSLSNIEITELSELELASSSSQFELNKASQSSSKDHRISYRQWESYSTSGCVASTSHSSNSLSSDDDISYKLFDYIPCDKDNSNNLKYQCSEKELHALKISKKCDTIGALIFNQKKVDFLHDLFEKNCYSIISYILSFLSAKELCIASCVSKKWNRVILLDSKANTRRQNLIKERNIFLNGPSKENRKGMKCGPAKEHKSVLSDLTNIGMSLNTVNVKVSNSRFNSFITESRNSKSRVLKCPRCFHASKKVNEDRYMCTRCSYNFCSICLDPFYISHTCFKSQVPSIIVGSKKSKKNLRRL